MLNTQEFVQEYFAAAIDPDPERYHALFAEQVVVRDDGKTHRGLAEVRAWRSEVPPVRYRVREVSGPAAACRATAEISGDFPGSPVTLHFVFERDTQGRITSLSIEP
ncbi:nuclear transport factor 2 family protein [Myceligenerans indicum]|uniref:Nuclear transport factor 2 family protein n=1 Tax=Myceligenerans indicum TaxID=2593663 RepID=A0ABS1LIS3_9MICO|nr:nuclear transport factor 2 family protein [Myceligenerans indicum]MBL0885939.1 nuclear transport factor 2 family protein [Myceligenerans indicum]